MSTAIVLSPPCLCHISCQERFGASTAASASSCGPRTAATLQTTPRNIPLRFPSPLSSPYYGGSFFQPLKISLPGPLARPSPPVDLDGEFCLPRQQIIQRGRQAPSMPEPPYDGRAMLGAHRAGHAAGAADWSEFQARMQEQGRKQAQEQRV
eukprot:1021932-Rhodomonas_salina.3